MKHLPGREYNAALCNGEAQAEICILHKGVFFIPECGCNGVTYSNDCERRKAGVSLAHKGKC